MSDQDARLQAVLDDLRHNRLSLADAAAQVRAMHLPAHPVKSVSRRFTDSYENEAPEPDPEGSFRLVARAHAAGEINLRQYEVLAAAAGDALRRNQGDRSPGHGSDSAGTPAS